MYADDHNDLVPPIISRPSGNDWRSFPGSWVLGNAKLDADPTNITSGVLFPHVQGVGIYRCPADRSVIAGATSKPARLRSYSLNMAFGGAGDLKTDPLYPFVQKISQLADPSPAQTFAFIDVTAASIDTGDFCFFIILFLH